jgi:hypothetical protein
MTRALALALLFAVTPQDDLARRIEEIIPRLSDDAIDVRDGAVQALADLGPAALPILRKRAAELGGETKGRLIEACGKIESRNTLAKFLPPLKRITLDWENKPAREALDEVSRRTGLVVETAGANLDGAITFMLKDASPIQALDEICRQASLTWRNGDDDVFGRRRGAAARSTPRVLLHNGKNAEYPASYVRHYRMRVTQVSLTRTNTFQASQSTAQMTLDLSWPPDVKPEGVVSFKVTELRDDQGRSLLPEENERARLRARAMSRRYRGRDSGSSSQYVAFKFPDADAKRLSLKGTSVIAFPQELRTIAFPNPAEAAGKSIELNGLTITLKDYQEKGTVRSVTLEMSGRYNGPRDVEAGEDEDFGNLPFSYEDVELVSEAGDPMRSQGMSGRGDGKTYTWQLDFDGDKAGVAKEIRIPCVLRRFLDEAVFEIKDIALPK